jgi:hypothetical protein
MNEFSITGNRIVFTVPLSDKEYFLLNRYVWPIATLDGKDTNLNVSNDVSLYLLEDGIDVKMQFSANTGLQEAYDQALQKYNEIRDWVDQKMEPFWQSKKSWEAGVDNLMAAIGLAPRFEEEGGES